MMRWIMMLLIGLSLGYAQTDSLNIYWSPNKEPDMHSYRLYRAVNEMVFSHYQTIAHPDTHAVDKDVQPGNLYVYYLTAVDSAGNESDPSDTVSAGVPDVQLSITTLPFGQVYSAVLDSILYDPDNTIGQLVLLYMDLDHVRVYDSVGVLYVEPDPGDYYGPAGFVMIVTDTMGLWDSTHVRFNIEAPTVVDNTPPAPPKGFMIAIYPNPVTSIGTVLLSIPEAVNVALSVYDVLGREVLHREYGRLGPGRHIRQLDMRSLPAGTYFYQVRADNQQHRGRFVILKP